LAHSRNVSDSNRRRTRYLRYAIPLIAILGIGIVYTILTLPVPSAPAAMDFTFQLVIQVSNRNSTGIRGIVPNTSIGEAGGLWNTTRFNNYAVDSQHYPLYMDSPQFACPGNVPPCTIHVKSKTVYSYTLGDFFNVWGMLLGENDTMNIKSSGSFAWQLCIGSNPSTATLSNAWGSLVLQSNLQLVLFYADSSQAGCASI
jgi:hypothetical protein